MYKYVYNVLVWTFKDQEIVVSKKMYYVKL